jgi:hypothetical protein
MRRCKKCNANFGINENECLFCGNKNLVVVETGFRYLKVWGNEIFANKVPESIKKELREKYNYAKRRNDKTC